MLAVDALYEDTNAARRGIAVTSTRSQDDPPQSPLVRYIQSTSPSSAS